MNLFPDEGTPARSPADFSTEDLMEELGRPPGVTAIILDGGAVYGFVTNTSLKWLPQKKAGKGPARILFYETQPGGRSR
jgi:hypothetical protein